MKTTTYAPWKGALALLAALALPASAARLAYEGFDYTQANGTSVGGLNGGTGWLEAYPTPDGPHVLADGLTFTGLTTMGKSMNRSNGTLTGDGRNWATSVDTAATYWYSLLVRSTTGDGGAGPEGTFNLFQEITGSLPSQNGTGLEFRKGSPNVGDLQIKVIGNGGATDVKLVPPAQTHWVLGKVTNSSHQVWVYAQGETLPTVEPTTGGTTMTGTLLTNRRPALAGRRFGSSGANSSINFDEIRLGTTFADTLPPPTLVLSPKTGVEGQELTFTWGDIPAGVTAMELDPGDIVLTPSASGSTTLPAPAANTTYTLTYTVGGIDSTLTQDFTVIPPSFTLSPTTAYPGQTLTFNWRLPVGSSPIEIDNSVGTVSIDATGAGTTTVPAPIANTTYTLTYTNKGTVYTLTQNFTLGAPFLDVSPSQAVEATTPLTITWRVPVGVTAVTLQSGPTGGPYSTPQDVFAMTNETTGAGALTPNPTPVLGNTEYKLTYTLDSVDYTLTDTLEVFPKIFEYVTPSNTANGVVVNPGPMNDGVLAYSDREHKWAAVPSILQGAQFVKFAQNDKLDDDISVEFKAAKDATFFLLIDNRIGDGVGGTNPTAGTDDPPDFDLAPTMSWVLSSGFVDSGLDIGLDEKEFGDQIPGINASYSVYFRQVAKDEIFIFGAQNDGNLRNMYGIAGVSPQVVPVTFFANPAAINSNVANSTQLNWTVPANVDAVSISPPPPGTEPSGNVLGNTTPATGVGFVNVFPTVTTTYTLTYDPQGASPPVILPSITVHVNSLTATPSEYTVGGSTTLGWKIPPGSTNVLINGGVGDVTTDTLPTGIGSKAGVTAGVGSPSYTLTYIAPGATTTTTVGPVMVTVNPIPTTPFEDWMSANHPGITAPNNAAGADPDGDGRSNFGEFAFSGNPSSGSDAGIIRSAIDNISGTNHLTLTFACRTGATFTGAGPMTGSVDGVDYTVRASTDLSAFTVGLDEVTPAITTGLPDPAPDGYEYRTFRVTAAQSANPKAFMQAIAAPTPTP